jgi:hypothetical protein
MFFCRICHSTGTLCPSKMAFGVFPFIPTLINNKKYED